MGSSDLRPPNQLTSPVGGLCRPIDTQIGTMASASLLEDSCATLDGRRRYTPGKERQGRARPGLSWSCYAAG